MLVSFFVDIFLMYDKISAQEKPVCPPVSLGPRGFLYTGCTMANKSYKSYRQQLNILQSRGMVRRVFFILDSIIWSLKSLHFVGPCCTITIVIEVYVFGLHWESHSVALFFVA